MTIMKRLLLPFLLLGLALLPSGISAAKQGASQTASDLQVAVPAHGKPHHHKHPHPRDGDTEADAEQEARDNDEQESEQTNIVDGQSLIGDVIPIAANIPVIPINNLQVIGLVNSVIDVLPVNLEVIPVNLCAVIPVVTGEEIEEAECELEADQLGRHNEQEQSQLRNQEAHSGNDTYNQSNEAEQEQEGEQEQEQGQINVGESAPARTGSSQPLLPTG